MNFGKDAEVSFGYVATMTTVEGDVISVRRATLKDFRSVMEMSQGIYFGWDYLPRYYHVYLQDKRSNCFVITAQGRVASKISSGVERFEFDLLLFLVKLHSGFVCGIGTAFLSLKCNLDNIISYKQHI